MKELYIQPEIEILLPLTEDIMTSSGNVPGDGDVPTNPDAALPSVPSGSGNGGTTPSDDYQEPEEADRSEGGANVDQGTI